jgi:hypothetical protein
MSIEIDQLNSRLVEAETKLKTEVQRIRKKLQITITELELTLDVANKNNIELQKSLKKQSLQLTVNWNSTPVNFIAFFITNGVNYYFDNYIRNFNRCTKKHNVSCKSLSISMA